MSARPRVRQVPVATDVTSTNKLPDRLRAVLEVGTRLDRSTNSMSDDVLEVGVKNTRGDSEEEIMYVLGKRTVKSMPMVLNTLSEIIYWGMHDEDPQDDSSAHEVYLLDELRDGDRHLDITKILKLLEDEANHLKVMAALAVMTDYDIDLRETLDELDHEELTEFKRIWALLPRWARAADEPAAKKATA